MVKRDSERDAAEKQILQLRKPISYDTIEYPIGVIIDKIDIEEPWNGEWFVPEYQREFIWPISMKRFFIESILLAVPIPYIFIAEMRDGRHEIVDGSQRIRTLYSFVNDGFELRELKKLTKANGFKFSDLPQSERRKFLNRSLKTIRLSEAADEQIRQDLFNRINRSERMRESEIRRGSFKGKYYSLIEELSNDQRFRSVCPFSKTSIARREPEEYVSRFLCYKHRYKDFKHDVREFIDSFIIEMNKSDNARMVIDEDRKDFKRMVDFAHKNLPYGFKRTRSAKSSARVRFEALSVGIILALEENPDLKPKNLEWLESDEFSEHTRSDGSNSGPKLRGRIEFVRDKLLGRKC